jgi:hypothetical protein
MRGYASFITAKPLKFWFEYGALIYFGKIIIILICLYFKKFSEKKDPGTKSPKVRLVLFVVR